MSNQFWANNLSILFEKEYLTDFFPDIKMTLEEKLNAIVRLSLYITLVLFVFNKDPTNIYYAIITMALTYFVYHNNNKETYGGNNIMNSKQMNDNSLTNFKSQEQLKPFKNTKQIESTYHNPYANILLSEYGNGSRQNNIDMNSKESMDKVRNNFSNNLYRDANDIFGKNNSQRQFMMNPIQTIPNNQNDFARWCYAKPPTCKEGNVNECIGNTFRGPHGISRNKQFGKL